MPRRASGTRVKPLRTIAFATLMTAALAIGIVMGTGAVGAPAPPPVPVNPTEKQPPMTPMLPSPEEQRFEDAYAMEAGLDLDWPAVQLVPLPGTGPVGLWARAAQAGTLPEGWSERGRRIEWMATSGRIEPTAGAEGEARALFHPEGSTGRVMLRATLRAELVGPAGEARMVEATRTLLVLPPMAAAADGSGIVDGYDVGKYPDPADPAVRLKYNVQSLWPTKYPDKYSAPQLFYKVELSTRDLLIAPHQTLGLYAIDYPWFTYGLPQYVALDLNLVRKLEDLAALLGENGIAVTRFKSIYGFRSPRFNLGKIEVQPDINLKEPFSMHQYGRAIDLIVDEDGDNFIDDLNRDGVIDHHDAVTLMHYVNILDRRYRDEGRMEMVGGAGIYFVNDFAERTQYLGFSTPYVHVDTRGFLTDNGGLVRWPNNWPDGTPIRWGQI